MSDLKDIVIVGAGGLGREIVSVLAACNTARKEWNLLGFLDSKCGLVGSEVSGLPVLGSDDWCQKHSHQSVWVVCGIGDPKIRHKIAEKFSAIGCKFASVVHPDVRIPHSIRIDAGTVVMAGT